MLVQVLESLLGRECSFAFLGNSDCRHSASLCGARQNWIFFLFESAKLNGAIRPSLVSACDRIQTNQSSRFTRTSVAYNSHARLQTEFKILPFYVRACFWFSGASLQEAAPVRDATRPRRACCMPRGWGKEILRQATRIRICKSKNHVCWDERSQLEHPQYVAKYSIILIYLLPFGTSSCKDNSKSKKRGNRNILLLWCQILPLVIKYYIYRIATSTA
jgi:hypothetical protein